MKTFIYSILAFLAKKIIARYQPLVVGITGSVGKTSTKEAVAVVLAKKYRVRATQKSYNNEIGLPLTVIGKKAPGKNPVSWIGIISSALRLLVIKDATYPEVLVLEMGADHPGDIAYLTSIAPCAVGVVTAIAPVHLEFFKNTEAILQEKRIILTHLAENSTAIYNHDDQLLAEQKTTDIKAKILTYGFDGDSMVRAIEVKYATREVHGERVQGMQGKLVYEDMTVPFFLPGVLAMHHVYTALAATAVGLAMEMNLVDISQQLYEYQIPPGRLKYIEGIRGISIIDDSYNSSPEAAKAALSVLHDYPRTQGAKIIAVLGDMRELGSDAEQLHREVGHTVAELGIDVLITFGPESVAILSGAREAGMRDTVLFHAESHDEIVKKIEAIASPGDVVLVKGSQNTIRLEKVVKQLMAHPEEAEQLLVRQGKEWE